VIAIKPLLRRKLASEEIASAIEHYLAEGGAVLADRFIDDLEAAFDHIARAPGTGSTRYAPHTQRPDLRFWQIKRFPYLIFYIELEARIDVLRVLHASRDIPASLLEGP
jgi:toxin ParE1/3/4